MGRVDRLKSSQVLATTPAPSAHQNRMKPTITQLQSLLLCCYSTESRFTELAKAASAADPPAPQLLDVIDAAAVGPSKVDGLGLHASRDLEPGTLVTLYPVHAMGDEEHCLTFDESGHFENAMTRPYRVGCTHEAFKEAKVWVDANPDRPRSDGWLGHMVNDAAIVDSGEDEMIEEYYDQAKANVVLVPLSVAPLMAWVTRCTVPRGAECLGTYGHDYWLSRGGREVPAFTPRVIAAASGWKADQRRAREEVSQRYENELALLGALMEVE